MNRRRLLLSGALGVVVHLVTSLTSGLIAFFLALGISSAVSGCPKWQRPRCETPGAYSCVQDHPHYCAPSRELTPIGDESCRPQGRVCGLDDAGVASCEERR